MSGFMQDIPWSEVIAKSFYYSEYFAFAIEEVPEGIVLHGWEKLNNTAYSQGSLFLKPEWIIHVINIIRAVPKEVLNRGEGPDEEAYGGQWSRGDDLPKDDTEDIEISLYVKNTYYERSLPKLRTSIMVTNPKVTDFTSKGYFVDYPLLKNRDEIEISHGDGVDGYIRYVEPVLTELEKYLPEKDKVKILPPIGKVKTELEKEFEDYEERCRKDKKYREAPKVRWIKKQVSDTNYEVTQVIFYDGKIDYQKTITCSAKEMAMASKHFDVWAFDIETIPYKYDNQLVELEISESSRYKDHKNAKLLIKNQNDFFEVPFMYYRDKKTFCDQPFYDLMNYTEAEKLTTHYARQLEAFFIDDYFALKWYSEEFKEIKEEYSELFYVLQRNFVQFYHVLIYIRSIENNKNALEALNHQMAGPFRFQYGEYGNNGTVSFSINNDAIHNKHYHIGFTCFPEEFTQEFEKLYMLVATNCLNYSMEKKPGNELDFKKIDWSTFKDWRTNKWSLVWQFEEEETKHTANLSKEKIYKIQEYAYWWWRATKHDWKFVFEDEKIYFEINPESDKQGLGSLILNFKDNPESDVSAYFELTTGCNLPKDFCRLQYDNIVRRVQIDENPDLTGLISDVYKENFKDKDDYVFFNWWDSKYNDYDEKTRHFFAIDKSEFSDFVISIKELYDYLNNPGNKVAALLDKEVEKKYDRKGYWISIWAGRLGSDGDADLAVDEDIPLHITIYSRCEEIHSEYIPVVGTRHTLVTQFMELLSGLTVALR